MRESVVGSKDFGTDPFGGRGTVLTRSPTSIMWICEVSPGVYQTCEDTFIDPFLEENAIARSENAGKRWGDGRVVASMPVEMHLNGYYAEARKAGDEKAAKRWLNDRDNYKLRTFEGNL